MAITDFCCLSLSGYSLVNMFIDWMPGYYSRSILHLAHCSTVAMKVPIRQ